MEKVVIHPEGLEYSFDILLLTPH